MSQSTAARANSDEYPQPGNRPAARFKHGTVELTVWPNHTENGTMYNTTISNSYKDEKTGDWKQTSSFSPTDLLVVGELSREAFAEINKLKQLGRSR